MVAVKNINILSGSKERNMNLVTLYTLRNKAQK